MAPNDLCTVDFRATISCDPETARKIAAGDRQLMAKVLYGAADVAAIDGDWKAPIDIEGPRRTPPPRSVSRGTRLAWAQGVVCFGAGMVVASSIAWIAGVIALAAR